MKATNKIWNEIKDTVVDVFARPDALSTFCALVEQNAKRCVLEPKATALLPALENALGSKYSVILDGKYIVVERNAV